MNRIRCAIYTRKSSEDGLEKGFNSLDAQREACEAYIASQRHEGWVLLPDHYDDGGISGGHMDRPALQQLMHQVDAKQIDQIVVYKIDRLTRSLADFAKLVDRLDQASASFVSVTQSFNTATSMGRLTLNVLLSFAQFEREVTAERIRDKIAASKRKGLWMGGNVPLGYEPNGRTLEINPSEAKTVCRVYDLYEQTRSVSKTHCAANKENLRSKHRTGTNGVQRGGNLMSRGHIHHILTNPIYSGRIRHKRKVHEGQHDAIIEPTRRDTVQSQLTDAAMKKRAARHHRNPSPLAGQIFDGAGEKLTPSHTRKGDKRYRYYISQRLVTGVSKAEEKQRTWRIPAVPLEKLVAKAVKERVSKILTKTRDQLLDDVGWHPPDEEQLLSLVRKLTVNQGRLQFELCTENLQPLGIYIKEFDEQDLQIEVPFTERRRGAEMKLVVTAAAYEPDQKLINNIILANKCYALLKQGQSYEAIASDVNTSKRRVQQLINMAFLAPDIVRDITTGTQPLGLTSDWCLRHTLPSDWDAQRVAISNL